MPVPERGSIEVVTGRVVSHARFASAQHVLTVAAPAIAARARPGGFVHVECGAEWLLRRPMSILSADGGSGEIELLFKEVGHGTRNLARLEAGDALSLVGPVGNTFTADPRRPLRLLLGGGVGIPPIVFFAETLARSDGPPPWVVAGSELPYPFETRPALHEVPGTGLEGMRELARLAERGIPGRLASAAGLPGVFRGFVTDLAETIIKALPPADRRRLALFACGPEPMLAACASLARRHDLPCEVALEEFMACAVGGCAGCNVEVATPRGPAMKRVCVDGPVFDAAAVYPSRPFPDPAETPID